MTTSDRNPGTAALRVAVVGAGMAGLTCARNLVGSGLSVTVFEKARGPGGRMSSRRTDFGAIDHGAQYFSVRDPRFRARVQEWISQNLVQEWDGRLVAIDSRGISQVDDGTRRYVGVPRMSAITRHLSKGCTLLLNWHVSGLERLGSEWWLRHDEGARSGPFDGVVLALPAPQAVALLEPAPSLAERAAEARMIGCYAVMLGFRQRLDLPFDGAFVNDGPLSWIARNSSKPGRRTEADGDGPETWVLHGAPAWSEAHIDLAPEEIPARLLAAFEQTVRTRLPLPAMVSAHRWRYALPLKPIEPPCLLDTDLGIGACGDWCGGPRVEGAFLSGSAMAGVLLDWAGDGKSA